MLSELAQDELAEALDAAVAEMLHTAGVTGPPIDARVVAAALGLAVAWDDRQRGRARFVRIAHTPSPHPLPGSTAFGSEAQARRALTSGKGEGAGHGSILLRPEPRLERLQWAIAHELGEQRAAQICTQLGLDPARAAPRELPLREIIANQLANRLLLPTGWFSADGNACDWDLLTLKARYSTASHELIARRMLDCDVPVIISICDQGRLAWRRGNTGDRVPPLAGVERACWQESHRQQHVVRRDGPGYAAQCWPIHEAGWQREILRTQPSFCSDYCDALVG